MLSYIACNFSTKTMYETISDAFTIVLLPFATVNVKGYTYDNCSDIHGKYTLGGIKNG